MKKTLDNRTKSHKKNIDLVRLSHILTYYKTL